MATIKGVINNTQINNCRIIFTKELIPHILDGHSWELGGFNAAPSTLSLNLKLDLE